MRFLFTFLSSCITTLLSTPAHAVDIDKEVECLAKNAYFEARGEGEHGMRAVSHVVMNRVKDKKFPQTVCGVIYQKSQFVWTLNPRPITDWKIYEHAKKIALDAYHGISTDNSLGAKYFQSVSLGRKTYKIKIGRHIFY